MNKILLPIAALAFLMAGCKGTPTVTPNSIATDINLLANGLAPVAAQIAAIPGVSPATVAQITADLAIVQKDAALVAASTAVPTTSVLKEVVTAVQDLAAIATPVIPGGSATVAVIDAATSVAETLLQQAGVSVVNTNAKAVAPPVYSQAAAELILKGATK